MNNTINQAINQLGFCETGVNTCQYFSHQNQYKSKCVHSTFIGAKLFDLKASTFNSLKFLTDWVGQEVCKKTSQTIQFIFKDRNIKADIDIFLIENFLKYKI